VVAVPAPDGAPHAVPTWYEYKGGKVTFHTDQTAFKYKCLEHDPRITFVVDTKKAPYKCVILKGTATIEIKKHDDVRGLRMSIAYLGHKNGMAYHKTVEGQAVAVVTLKPERIISWDYSGQLP
jgi:nitroimidazol reductase NimA-like FMN-containing flavoprotein (pyridoxamine 5'-phosphate oxidase superfamily)